jgi:hypothetical protein
MEPATGPYPETARICVLLSEALNPWIRILIQNPEVAKLVKNFSFFNRTHHWTLSWTRWSQSTLSHFSSLRFLKILSFYLRLCILICFASLDFPLIFFFWISHFHMFRPSTLYIYGLYYNSGYFRKLTGKEINETTEQRETSSSK